MAGGEAGVGGPACTRATPDRAAVEAERVRAVRDAIAELPHDLKVTLLLFEYEDLGYAEIAPVVGCSVKGVEARLARARQRLRETLERYLRDGERERRPGLPETFSRVAGSGEAG